MNEGEEVHIWDDGASWVKEARRRSPLLLRCGLWISSPGFAWKIVRNGESWTPSQTDALKICILVRSSDDSELP